MYDIQNGIREIEWNSEKENFEETKRAILVLLKEQKVSLSKIRKLFNSILIEIEDENPITY